MECLCAGVNIGRKTDSLIALQRRRWIGMVRTGKGGFISCSSSLPFNILVASVEEKSRTRIVPEDTSSKMTI